MTGSGDKVYLKVIKNGNLLQLVDNKISTNCDIDKNKDFDNSFAKALNAGVLTPIIDSALTEGIVVICILR